MDKSGGVPYLLGVTLTAAAVVVAAQHLRLGFAHRPPAPSLVGSSSHQLRRECLPYDLHHAVNYLNQSGIYQHHPVMSNFCRRTYRIKPGTLVEFIGLIVPHDFDCKSNRGADNVIYAYMDWVPARWLQCFESSAVVSAGFEWYAPTIFPIDEEYFEAVAVFEMVFASAVPDVHGFVIHEIGARWGTWGARALVAMRDHHPRPSVARATFFEANAQYCRDIDAVMALNGFGADSYAVHCGWADGEEWIRTTESLHHVDILDLDIQGAELPFFQTRGVMDVVKRKVRRVIIGTHSRGIHDAIAGIFAANGFAMKLNVRTNFGAPESCLVRFRTGRGNRNSLSCAADFEDYGKAVFGDGELVFDNLALWEGTSFIGQPYLHAQF